MDPYGDLGLTRDASPEEIKAAHRKGVTEHHPDKGGKREDFDRVQRAYMVLSNPDRRQRYDETGDAEDPQEINETSILMGFIMRAFDQACGAVTMERIEHVDLVEVTVACLEKTKVDLAHQNRKLESTVRNIRRVMKRLKFKGDGSDMIGIALRRRIEQAEMQVADNKEQIEFIPRCIEHARLYGYDFIKPMPQATQSWPSPRFINS